MIMIRELNSKSDVSKLYVCSKDDGRVLACIKIALALKKTILFGVLNITLKIRLKWSNCIDI